MTRIDFGGSVSKVDSFLKKSVVSLRYDGICTTRGRRWWSTYSEIHSVGAPHEDTIGLPGFLTLWIFGRW